MALVLLTQDTPEGSAGPRSRHVLLSSDPALSLLTTKIRVTLDPRQGLLTNLAALSEQSGVNLITVLSDRKVEGTVSDRGVR